MRVIFAQYFPAHMTDRLTKPQLKALLYNTLARFEAELRSQTSASALVQTRVSGKRIQQEEQCRKDERCDQGNPVLGTHDHSTH
jgi:hypothetical protein